MDFLSVRSVLKLFAGAVLGAFVSQAVAEIYKCQQPDGKSIYQNFPCGTKPEVEQKPPAEPDYPKIVKCGMLNGLVGTLSAAVGKKRKPEDCQKQ